MAVGRRTSGKECIDLRSAFLLAFRLRTHRPDLGPVFVAHLTRILLPVAAALVGLSLGFLHGNRPPPRVVGLERFSATDIPANKVSAATPEDVALEAKVRRFARVENRLRHSTKAWDDLLDSIAIEQFPRLLTIVPSAPAPALAAAVVMPMSAVRDAPSLDLLGRWSRLAPAAAMDYALARPRIADRESGLIAVMQGWADADLPGALNWAANLPPGPLRNVALAAILPDLALSDLDKAVAQVLSFPPGIAQLNAVQTVLLHVAASNPDAALDLLRKVGVIIEPGKQRGGRNALQLIAVELARKDPAAAARWIESVADHEDPSMKASAMAGIARRWARQEPMAAARHFRRLPELTPRRETLMAVARSWGASDPMAAIRWNTENMADDEWIARQFHESVVGAWAAKSPAELASYAATLPPGSYRQPAIQIVFENWPRSDPAAALAWLASIGDTESRHLRVLQSWVGQDIPAATDWVAALPEGKKRDEAFSVLLTSVKQTLPATAASIAERFAKPTPPVRAE